MGAPRGQKWWWMGVALGVIAVVLVVVFAVANTDKGEVGSQDYNDGYDRATLASDCVDRDEYNGIMLCIENDYYRTGDLERAMERYDKAINDKIEKENWSLAASLIVAKANLYYLETENCEAVFEMLKGQNLSDFPDSVKTIVYSSAAGLGYECGDDTEMYYWDALYNDVIGEGYGVVDEE